MFRKYVHFLAMTKLLFFSYVSYALWIGYIIVAASMMQQKLHVLFFSFTNRNMEKDLDSSCKLPVVIQQKILDP